MRLETKAGICGFETFSLRENPQPTGYMVPTPRLHTRAQALRARSLKMQDRGFFFTIAPNRRNRVAEREAVVVLSRGSGLERKKLLNQRFSLLGAATASQSHYLARK
jgi:hypothetical protein